MAKHRRTKANGRSSCEQFMTLPYHMVRSEAWRSLSGPALKILIELYSRFNGGNNGTLTLSYADAAKMLGLGRATIRRAFDELEEKGFARLVKKGRWYGRKAGEWAITNKPCNGNLPTNEWAHWRKPRTSKTEIGSDTVHIHP